MLEQLYERRSDAFAQADLTGLRNVYAPGSADLRSNERLVRELVAQQVRPREVPLDVVDVEVLGATRDRAVLRTTDRLGDYTLVDPDGHLVAQRAGRGAEVVDVVLVHSSGEWRILSTTETGRAGGR